LCLVRADNARAALWAAEQALRCRDVVDVMA
jgi:protein ImuA